jgi:hypothetical protein
LAEGPLDLGQKTFRRHENKKNVGRKPNGFRIEDPEKTQRQKKVLVEGPMDLGQKTPKRHKDKRKCC